MKKFYEKFFYIPKHGKIRESVMLARITTTVIISLMCLAAMGLTAYAYFSCNVTSASNRIHSAKFETALSVEAMPTNGEESIEAPTVNTAEGKHTVSLSPHALYKFTLNRTENCTADTGYLIVTATDCDSVYHTQQLGVDGEEMTQEISFYISVSSAASVTFEERWGTSSYYYDYKENGDTNELYITANEAVALDITPPANGNTLSENTQTEVNEQDADSPDSDSETEDSLTAPEDNNATDEAPTDTETEPTEQTETNGDLEDVDPSAETGAGE